MKFKYLLLTIFTFFIFNMNSNALLSLCSYKCVRANGGDSGNIASKLINGSINEQAMKGKSVLMFDNTRSELYLSFVDELSLTQSSIPIPGVDLFISKYNSIAYGDLINNSGGTFIRFNPEMTRGNFWGNTIANLDDRHVDIRWYYPTFNEDGSPSSDYVDPKEQYIEYGKCPKYFFYDGDDFGEIKSGATLKFADYDTLVDPQSANLILGGNDFLYRVEWNIIKGYTFKASELNSEVSLNMWKNTSTGQISIGGNLIKDGNIYRPMKDGCYTREVFINSSSQTTTYYDASGHEISDKTTWENQCLVKETDKEYIKLDLGLGVEDLLLMLLKGTYYNMTDDQLTVVTYLLNLSYGTATATDREKFMFARVLNNYYPKYAAGDEGYGLYYQAANYIVTISKDKNSLVHKPRYEKLLEAATKYVTYSTGKTIINSQDVKDECGGILGDVNDKESFAYYLQIIFRFIQYVGPILVIILTTVDYFKAMMSGDDSATKKVNKRTITRLIAIACLYFIPMIVQLLLNLFDITSDCGIS